MTDEYLQTYINGQVQDKITWLHENFRPLAVLIKGQITTQVAILSSAQS